MDQAAPADTSRKTDGTWMIALGAVIASLGAYAFQVVGGRSRILRRLRREKEKVTAPSLGGLREAAFEILIHSA